MKFTEPRGFDPFEVGTRSDVWELSQETTPLDLASLQHVARGDSPPSRRDSSRRLRSQSGRHAPDR